MKKKYTQEDIENLYGQYKSQREVIDPLSYNLIRQAVRQKILSRNDEVEINKIMQTVKQYGLANRASSLQTWQQDSRSTSYSFFSKIKDSITENINKQVLHWVGAGTTIAGVLAITLTFTSPFENIHNNQYMANMLLEEKQYIAELMKLESDWQLGFASVPANEFAAFRSGALVSGWINQMGDDSQLSSTNKQQIINYLQNSSSARDYELESLSKIKTLSELDRQLEQFYANNEHDLSMYKLGQWTQYHYLLASVAEKQQRRDIFVDNFKEDLQLMQQAVNYFEINNILSEKDLEFFKQFNKAEVHSLTVQQLEDLKWQLLRIKTLLQNT